MVVVSAPGKILLAGGYLVLEENNCGLVVAVNRRFYCQCDAVVRTATTETTTTDNNTTTIILVQSPQFATQWKYIWDGNTMQSHVNNTTSNVFIEKTVRVVLYYLTAEGIAVESQYSMLHLKLAADNDFYSLIPHLQHHQLQLYEGDKLPRCLPATISSHPTNTTTTTTVLKTGLGSSACLVTALVAAMVQTLLRPLSASDTSIRRPSTTSSSSSTSTTIAAESLSFSSLERICALAQLSHCHAQGKIGSGFDVSAACYGSHVYRRFSPTILEPLLAALEQEETNGTATPQKIITNHHHHPDCCPSSLIQSIVNGHGQILGNGVQRPVHSFQDSSFLQIMLADVSMGSESPSMARTILQWKHKQQERNNSNESSSSSTIPHWDDLAILNSQVIDLLSQLDDQVAQRQTNGGGGDCRSRFASLPAHRWSELIEESSSDVSEMATLLIQLHQTFTNIRRHLKQLGEAAGVPVEPNVQTTLCDATGQLPGVVTTLVPGAGGYDAIACIYIHDQTVRQNVAQFWANYYSTTTGSRKDDEDFDDDTNGVAAAVTAVCALTVAGVDHGQGLVVEDRFPIL